ncbi:unnamed protein product [Coregonus sp. 'balchen']|nr:unnamed protein product [Coregonus sp. 'balchen']
MTLNPTSRFEPNLQEKPANQLTSQCSEHDSDIQKKIDHEIRMRDGACKLLAACSQRDQALEASKSLLTCNTRIMAYMSELQRMKEAQVMQRVALRSEGKRARGRDLRIPLMWKDTEYFKNKGVLLKQRGLGLLRIRAASVCSVLSAPGSTPRKLASKLSSSLGRSAGKKLRVAMDPGACSPISNGGGATLLLPLPSVDSFRTHDLNISGNEDCSYWVPLYGSVCCRLAAQPHCMTQQMMSGCLKVKQLGGDLQSWTNIYGVLKGTNLFCYHRQEDMEANVEPVFTIAINKKTIIGVSEKDLHSKAQSICISNHYGGEEVTHTLSADSREDTHRWMEAFWQQFYDMSQWKQCCDDLMKIELPSPRKPALVASKQGSLYHEMVIDTSDDINTVTNILTQRMQELELRSQLGTSPHWMSLFEESPGRPHTRHCLPHSPLRCPWPGLLSSDASLTSDSDSPCSTSPCSRHSGWAKPLSLSSPSSRFRPRTLSLDAKLSTLRGRGYGGVLQCSCQPPSSSSLAPIPAQGVPQATLSCSSSTSSNSSSEGSHSPELSDGTSFSRPSSARRSLRNLRAKLDPRNWLQSQV